MTSRDLEGIVLFVVDEGVADDSDLDPVHDSTT